jgi:hypothetical protein
VNAALQRVFASDKDFKEFLEAHPDAGQPDKPVAVRVPRRRKPESDEMTAA